MMGREGVLGECPNDLRLLIVTEMDRCSGDIFSGKKRAAKRRIKKKVKADYKGFANYSSIWAMLIGLLVSKALKWFIKNMIKTDGIYERKENLMSSRIIDLKPESRSWGFDKYDLWKTFRDASFLFSGWLVVQLPLWWKAVDESDKFVPNVETIISFLVVLAVSSINRWRRDNQPDVPPVA